MEIIRIDKFLFNLLVIIIPLYWAGGYLYAQGTFVHQIIVLSWYAVCVYYILYSFSTKMTKTGHLIIAFLLLNIFYWLISSRTRFVISSNVDTWGSLKFIFMAFMSYYPFYVLSKKRIVTDGKLTIFYLLLFVSLIFQYFYIADTLMEAQGSDATTNNIAYYFVMIFPLTFVFYEKKLLMITAYVATLFLVLFGAKRGAIVCFAVESFLFYHYFAKALPSKYKKITIAFLVVGFAYLFTYLYEAIQEDYFLMRRWEQTVEGNSSGRDQIYSSIWNYSIDSNLFNLLFGHGFMISPEIPGNLEKNYAHQDWLELFVGMGVMGVILYCCLIYSVFIYYHRNKKFLSVPEHFAYLCIIAIWIIKPFFSMLYYDPATFALTSTLGVLHGRIYNKRFEISNKL